MSGGPQLLTILVAILAAEGLEPPTVDPWPTWRAFKHFARLVDETPDPGVSVQLARLEDSSVRLFFVRQVLEPRDESWLEPAGGVICEFSFPSTGRAEEDVLLWSFDHGNLDEFVHRVEQHDVIADLMVRQAQWSSVYWEDA